MNAITNNLPVVKMGIVGVSRDCFPASLTKQRLERLAAELRRDKGFAFHASPVTVENENDAEKALADLAKNGANALCVYLGNFGPETPSTILAQRFPGPVMAMAAAEESAASLANDRGDALCGLLSFAYNARLRRLSVHIPASPVGDAKQTANSIRHFAAVARVVVGVRNLKVFGFGPRPQDFITCHAPLQPFYDLTRDKVSPHALPFDYHGAGTHLRRAVTAVHCLADVVDDAS